SPLGRIVYRRQTTPLRKSRLWIYWFPRQGGYFSRNYIDRADTSLASENLGRHLQGVQQRGFVQSCVNFIFLKIFYHVFGRHISGEFILGHGTAAKTFERAIDSPAAALQRSEERRVG